MVLLHSALKLRVLDESARLIFRNVGRMRLERVGVLETRHEDLVLAVGHDLVPCRIGYGPAGSGGTFDWMPASNGAWNRIVPCPAASYGHGTWSRPIDVRNLD